MSKPRIVFLDRDTTDANDIDLFALEALGEVEYFGITSPAETADRIAEAEIVLTNKVVIGAKEMDAAPNLKLIQVTATGVNNVDLDAARERDLVVCNVSGYSTTAVAQHVFACLLNLVTKVDRFAVESEKWPASPIFTRLDYPISELSGKTLGIVGMGSIGSEVAKIGIAFGMKIIAMARPGSASSSGDVVRLEKEDFFRRADVISLHCPLTEATRYLINTETLSWMKPTGILINTGRGDLVNEAALVKGLRERQIAAAGVDVVSVEPPPLDNPLIAADKELPNLFITPHTAWSSVEARQRLIDSVVENISNFLTGGEETNRI